MLYKHPKTLLKTPTKKNKILFLKKKIVLASIPVNQKTSFHDTMALK